MPMAVGLFVLADPVFRVIYWNATRPGWSFEAARGRIVLCLHVRDVQCHPAGERGRNVSIVSTLPWAAQKIAVVGTAAINIQGALVGSICCFAIICIVDYIFLCRALGSRLRLGRMLGAPLLSSLAMGAAAWAVYGLARIRCGMMSG